MAPEPHATPLPPAPLRLPAPRSPQGPLQLPSMSQSLREGAGSHVAPPRPRPGPGSLSGPSLPSHRTFLGLLLGSSPRLLPRDLSGVQPSAHTKFQNNLPASDPIRPPNPSPHLSWDLTDPGVPRPPWPCIWVFLLHLTLGPRPTESDGLGEGRPRGAHQPSSSEADV